MPSRHQLHPWYNSILALACLVLMMAPEALSAQARTRPPEEMFQPPLISTTREEIPDPIDDLGKLEPEDGKWLKDDEGREYFVRALPKNDGDYQWIDETTIKYKHWYRLTVLRHDDQHLYLKIFKPAEAPPLPTREEIKAQEDAALAAIAATYVPEAGEADRLTFSAFGNGLPKQGMWRNGLDVADVNGDGFLDIAHGPARKGTLVPIFFLGDGKGNWRRWSEVQFARAPYDYGDVAVGDLNGDGKADLVVACHLRGLIALIQDPAGRFKLWTEGLDLELPGRGGSADGFSSRAIELVDWNSDGRLDILALGEGPRPAGSVDGKRMGIISSFAYGGVVYVNQGDGTWRRLDKGLEHNGVFGDSVTTGDFDGDGRIDFLTSSNVLNRRDVLNLGRGTEDWERQTVDLVRPRALIQSVAAGDFNGDGRDDMAIAFASWEKKVWRSGLDILLSTKTGGWQRHNQIVEQSKRSVWSLTAGDLDGDGALDLVGATGDGELWILLGDGKGRFDREASPEIQTPRGCRGYGLEIVDLDGDDRGEIIASFAGEDSALPLPDFPVSCPSGGEISVWRPEVKAAQAALDTN